MRFTIYDKSQSSVDAQRLAGTTVSETQEEPHITKAREQARWSESQERAGWPDDVLKIHTTQRHHPKPNSASKMKPREDVTSRGSVRHHSRHSNTSSKRMRTMPREESIESGTRRILSSLSSAPASINNPVSARKENTYGASSTPGGTKGRSSKMAMDVSADPRLSGRTQQLTLKRKSTGQVVKGYEQERKKRVTVASSIDATASSSRRRSSRSGTQQSTSDVPMFSHNQSLRGGSESQSQSQGARRANVGTRATRNTRSKKTPRRGWSYVPACLAMAQC